VAKLFTKFEVCSFCRSEDIIKNYKVGHMTLTTPLSSTVCHRQARTCYDKPMHQSWSA